MFPLAKKREQIQYSNLLLQDEVVIFSCKVLSMKERDPKTQRSCSILTNRITTVLFGSLTPVFGNVGRDGFGNNVRGRFLLLCPLQEDLFNHVREREREDNDDDVSFLFTSQTTTLLTTKII